MASFPQPIQSAGQLEKFAKQERAIVFHSNYENDPGYRDLRMELKPLVNYCRVNKRPYYNLLVLEGYALLKDFSDAKKKPVVVRGITFYKKGELLFQTKGFDKKDFLKALDKFDSYFSSGGGCCSGCVIL
ncbi:hypothetical protein LPJ57_001453 [Coemansia sp. RSA 486]|nr:hypothetical protein LPJ57_001453 [Coemansia sp. RSA 486]